MSRKQHNEYLERLCLLCLKKVNIQEKGKVCHLTSGNKELIIRHIYPELNSDEDWLPKVLCPTLVQFCLPDR